jgi:hypothetical protein
MRFALFLIMLALAGAVVAQPSSVLVYNDTYGGYGDAVLTAIANVWPGATVDAFTGGTAGQQAFNTALSSGSYDVIIIECWYYDTDDLDWAAVDDLYDTGGGTLVYASSWEWATGTSGQMDLANSMGVYIVTPDYNWSPHYVWDAGHPIVQGITDWTQSDPGINCKNGWMSVNNATPVTGWDPAPVAGMAGICVASDGHSVISGYGVAYANDGVNIWENILEFMASGMSLQESTWGAIKASF